MGADIDAVASPGMRKYRYGITHDPDGGEFNINFNPLDTEVDMNNYLPGPQGYHSPSPSPSTGQYREYSPEYDHVQLNARVPSPHQMQKSSQEIQAVHSAYSRTPVQPTKAALILKSPRPMTFDDFDLGLMGYGDFMDSYDDNAQPKSPTYSTASPVGPSTTGPLSYSTPRPTSYRTPRPLSHSTPVPSGYSTPGPLRYGSYSPYSHTPRPAVFSTARPIVYTPRPTPITFQPPVKFPQRVVKFPNSIDQNVIPPVTKFRVPKLQYGFKPMHEAQNYDQKPLFVPSYDDGLLESLADKAFSKVFMSHSHDQEVPLLYSHTDHVTAPGLYTSNGPVSERGLTKTLFVPVILIPGSDQIPTNGYVMQAYDEFNHDAHK